MVKDEETKTHVLEIAGNNSSTNYIVGPTTHKDGFGLKMPFLYFLVKNVILINRNYLQYLFFS